MSLATYVLAGLLAFVLGAVPFSWALARLVQGVDIRTVGSGNVGATNVARSMGYGPGLVALSLDAGKGILAVLAAQWIAPGDSLLVALAGGMAVLGHNFTPFLRFRGGKGVATGAGAFAVLAPYALLGSVLVFVAVVGVSRFVSLGSVTAAVALPVAVHFLDGDPAVTVTAALVAALVVVRHRSNLARMLRGTEERLAGRGSGSGPRADI